MEARRFRKPSFRALVLVAFLSAFGVSASTGVAYAVSTSAYGNPGFFTVGGITFENVAHVTTDASAHWANATTVTQKYGGTTPAGAAGSRGRLFIPNEVLMCEGVNTYGTTSSPSAVGRSCTKTNTISEWYSWGVSLGWNGNGYNSYYTYKSPRLNS